MAVRTEESAARYAAELSMLPRDGRAADAEDFESIVAFADTLAPCGADAAARVDAAPAPLRPDVPEASLPLRLVLQNAPSAEGAYLRVPRAFS